MPDLLLRSQHIKNGEYKFTLVNIGSPALNVTVSPISLRAGGMTRYHWRFSPVEYCTQETPVDLQYILTGRGVGVLSAESSHKGLRVITECDPFGEMFDNEVTASQFADAGTYPSAKVPLTIECEDQFGNRDKFSFILEWDRVNQTIFCRRGARQS